MRRLEEISPVAAIERVLGRLWTVVGVVVAGRWRLVLPALVGVVVGLALVTFRVSNAASYLSNEPGTCLNCHVMVPYYAGWAHSRHRLSTTCNDCHVPQDGLLRGLAFKALDGLRHSAVFTLRREPQAVQLNPAAVPVVQANCVRCHEQRVMRLDEESRNRLCWECHRETPHGLTQSLSSSPAAHRPPLPAAGFNGNPPGGSPAIHPNGGKSP